MCYLSKILSEPSTYGGVACGSIALVTVLDHVPGYLWAAPGLIAVAIVCAVLAVLVPDPGDGRD